MCVRWSDLMIRGYGGMGITGCPHAAVDVTSNVTYVDCRESDLLTRRSAQQRERARLILQIGISVKPTSGWTAWCMLQTGSAVQLKSRRKQFAAGHPVICYLFAVDGRYVEFMHRKPIFLWCRQELWNMHTKLFSFGNRDSWCLEKRSQEKETALSFPTFLPRDAL